MFEKDKILLGLSSSWRPTHEVLFTLYQNNLLLDLGCPLNVLGLLRVYIWLCRQRKLVDRRLTSAESKSFYEWRLTIKGCERRSFVASSLAIQLRRSFHHLARA